MGGYAEAVGTLGGCAEAVETLWEGMQGLWELWEEVETRKCCEESLLGRLGRTVGLCEGTCIWK